jgi:4-hydroxybenzoate polyprenyltransferase
MFAFLKLIRIQNLLIIAFTQYMIRWCILIPRLGHAFVMHDFLFFLLVLSTVMIAAAGYIINDYFDVRIDKVNKPERMVIDKGIKRRVAMGAHTVINVIAILIGFYVSYSVGAWKFFMIHVIAATGLWFYSTNFKRMFFIGNIVIALFTALVPFVVGLYQLPLGFETDFTDRNRIFTIIFSVSFFAFITTLLREIIKDIEDMEGDREYGCKTMPIMLGVKNTKRIIIALSLATMACLAYIQYSMFRVDFDVYRRAFYYFLFALQLPFMFLIWKVWFATSKTEFRFAGNTAKFIMLMGICYLFLHSHIILLHPYDI